MTKNKAKMLLALVGVALIATACTTVDADQMGLKVSRGKVKSCVGPMLDGPHPFSFGYKLARFSVGLQHTDMLKDPKTGDLKEPDAVHINAKGGAGFDQDVTINYRVVKTCEAIKSLYGGGVKSDNDVKLSIVRPAARSAIRDIAGNYTVAEFIATKRSEIADKIQAKLAAKMSKPPASGSVIIESIELRNSDLPDTIKTQVDATTKAEAEAQQAEITQRQRETEAQTAALVQKTANQQAIDQATADATKAKIQADGEANAARIAAQAQADANRLEAASLTPELVAYKTALAQAAALGKAGTVVVGGSGSSNSNPIVINTPSSK